MALSGVNRRIMGAVIVSKPLGDDRKAKKFMSCRACNSQLKNVEFDEYSICHACGSANYVSVRSAESDNAQYFDKVYSNEGQRPIETRYRHFERFEHIHSLFHAKEKKVFYAVMERMSKSIISAQVAVEVGFGSGQELAWYLSAGANMYGVEMSHEAVTKFKKTYPQYVNRVAYGRAVTAQVDVVYSNALFEHLDDPTEFLTNASSCLNVGGQLLLRLPVIAAPTYDRELLRWDINCWKPCHRVLYSRPGLEALFKAHGFMITESAPLAYYGYKVMSSMLRYGYMDIARVRSPYLPIMGLQSDRHYLKILIESLFGKLICTDYAVVATKIL